MGELDGGRKIGDGRQGVAICRRVLMLADARYYASRRSDAQARVPHLPALPHTSTRCCQVTWPATGSLKAKMIPDHTT